MASPNSLPTNPMERKAIAMVPATAPGPKMAMNSSAHTSELIERLDTRIVDEGPIPTDPAVSLVLTQVELGVAARMAVMACLDLRRQQAG